MLDRYKIPAGAARVASTRGEFVLWAPAPSVVMQDPKTQETLRCEATGFTAELAQLVIDECRKNYEKAGWVQVPS